MNISEFRVKHPEYDDMDDQTLASALYKKSYSDIPKAEFDAKFLGAPAPAQAPEIQGGWMQNVFGKVKDLPPGAKTADVLSPLDWVMSEGGRQAFKDAMPLGFGNEMNAAANALAAKVVHGDPMKQTYDETMAKHQKTIEGAPPGHAMAGMFTGGMGSGSLISKAVPVKTTKQLASLWGLLGGVEGAGLNEQNRGIGASIGATLGAGMPLAMAAGKNTSDFIGSAYKGVKSQFGHKVLPDEEVNRQVGRIIKNYSDTVGSPNTARAAENLGPGAVMADGSAEMRKLAGATARQGAEVIPGQQGVYPPKRYDEGIPELKRIIGADGGEIVQGDRAAGALSRSMQAVKDATGDTLSSAKGKLNTYSDTVRTNANKNYAAVEAIGELSEGTQKVLKDFIFGAKKIPGRPAMKSALNEAITAAKNRGKAVGFNRTKSVTGKVEEALDNATWELKQGNSIEASIKKLEGLIEGKKNVKITGEMVDDITRFLNDHIHEMKLGGGGGKSHDVLKLKEAWLELTDDIPELAALTKARTIYAEDLAPVKAFDEGYTNFDSMTVTDVAAKMETFTPAENQAFKEGVSANLNVKGSKFGEESTGLFDEIARRGSTRGAGNSGTADKMEAIFGGRAETIIGKASASERSFSKTADELRGAREAGLGETSSEKLLNKFKGLPFWGKRRAYSPVGVGYASADAVLESVQGGALSPQVTSRLRKVLLDPKAIENGAVENMLKTATKDEIQAINAALDVFKSRSVATGTAISGLLGAGKEDK